MKALTPKRTQHRPGQLVLLMCAAILTLALPGCNTSRAKGKLFSSDWGPHVGLVSGQLDAGVKVTLTIKNVGDAGFITINHKISSSEGEWTRSQNVQFGAGESKTLTYFFDEPTINATNIQCWVAISPEAN